ncbi:MAG TPA: hypothetical protein VIJ66_11650 [Solirubrobacteraceae bacterium]
MDTFPAHPDTFPAHRIPTHFLRIAIASPALRLQHTRIGLHEVADPAGA